jgi:hypothetical protein
MSQRAPQSRHGRRGPAIHVFLADTSQDVDARHNAGHDEFGLNRLGATRSLNGSVSCIFSLGIVGDRTDAVEYFGLKFASWARAISMGRDSKGQSPDRHDWWARAAEAMEKARLMTPGLERNQALKKAGQLQNAAEMMGYLKSKELRPPK